MTRAHKTEIHEKPLWPHILRIQDEFETADEKKRIELLAQVRNINYFLNNRQGASS